MANYITPTLSIKANTNAVTTGNKGPLSVALSLSASKLLSVDKVKSEILTVGTTEAILIDGSATNGGPGVGGTAGGFIFLSNITATGSNLIYIGTNTSAADAAVDLIGSPGAQVNRLFTLKPGEFAFLPFDYNMDIIVDANAASQTLEYWIFDRGA